MTTSSKDWPIASMTHHLNLRDEFRQKIEETLVPLIRGYDREICIIDPPFHPNVGDNAIFLGELNFLRDRFPKSKLCFFDFSTYSTHADDLIEGCSILLLHGGGNFGDIWMHHHQFRLDLLKRFRHKRIVQLPQSISFSSPSILFETSEAIKNASDFHLIVRDTLSEKFARENFDCPVYITPDMAFCMRPINRSQPSLDFLCLLRSDVEAVADHGEILKTVTSGASSSAVVDWLDEPETFIRTLDLKFRRRTQRAPKRTWLVRGLMLKIRERYAISRLNVGIEILSRGRTVVTDRLHAHILASLLSIPHLVFNSMDGKIAAFYDTWTYREQSSTMATSPADLLRLIPSRSDV